MKGKLDVESEAEKGSTFFFSAEFRPLHQEEEQAVTPCGWPI